MNATHHHQPPALGHGPCRMIAVLTTVTLLLSGCAAFKPEAPADMTSDLPTTYSEEGGANNLAERWWEALNDPELSAFVDRVLADNPSILEAWARLRQAQSQADKINAARFPVLDATAGAGSIERGGDTSGSSENYSLGLVGAYEVDLWGRVKAQSKTARFLADASESDRRTAALTLAATAVDAWTSLIAQREQITLLRQQLTANETTLELIDLRFDRSLASALDVFQQRQAVARVEGQIPLAQTREALLQHQLAVLMGLPPNTTNIGPRAEFPLPTPGPLPDLGLPSDLLNQRPDVHSSWLRLESSTWGLSAAQADRLPALRITAAGEYNADSVADLFDNWLLNLAANLTAPLLDGGRRKAEVERARAVIDERLAAYRGTVLTAYREVEDALVREVNHIKYLASLERELKAAQQAHTEAVERYSHGLSDYLPALTALTAAQNLENQVINQRLEHLRIRIDLFRALGGSWMQAMSAPENSTPRIAPRS
jgi:multidrug efflux system outer membrane protein